MNGILIVNKAKGYTSHDIVNKLRKILNIKQIGHAGTLDPNATGVLPVLIGQATKISKYLIEHDKEYIATLKLGEKRDTADSEGKVIEVDTNLKKLREEEIISVLDSFIGKQNQIPPIYSSIKINGKKAYEYAREGKNIEIQPREVEIYQIEFLEYKNDEIIYKVVCSKGTYIRTLCEDISKKLNTVGYMKELQRTKVDKFNLNNSYTLEEIEEGKRINVITIEQFFENKHYIKLDSKELKLFLNGVKLRRIEKEDTYRIYHEEKFIGLGIIKNNFLKRDIVIA